METNNKMIGLFQDLLEVQKEIETIDKDGTNPYFGSGYATLGATINACKKILNSHNFIVLQPLESDVDGVYVATTLYHTSGQKIKSKMRINQKEQNNPQAQGSAISYARRYSLQSILCMTAADDDGNSATVSESKKTSRNRLTQHELPKKCNLCGTMNQFHKPGCPGGTK